MYEISMDGHAFKSYRSGTFSITTAKEIYKIAKKMNYSVRNSPSHMKNICFLSFYFCISVFLKARQPTALKLSQHNLKSTP